jgi:hypothetical protein
MTTPPQDLSGYVAWIVEQHPEARDLEPSVQAELRVEWEERLDGRINRAFLNALTPVKLHQFEHIIDRSPAESQAFLTTNIPNMDEIVAAVLLKFCSEHLPDDS